SIKEARTALTRGMDWYVFIFSASKYGGKLIDSNEGNLEWIKDSELFNLNLWDGDKIFMEWVNAKRFFSAKFNYDNGKMLNYNVTFYDNNE
ncbi:MAG TPA: hypothetical protein PK559_10215, partial [Ignavibacteriaceae bacterium]|nr:hypothetical protein [Ignavibacteriaceae bacterium]